MSPRRFLQYSLLVPGILVISACRIVTTSNVSATQTAQTNIIETTVAATLAAPTPRARIVEPLDGSTSSPEATVVIEYHDIPQDRYLWVVVRVPSVKPVWTVYPQLQEGIPEQATGSGALVTTVWLGGEQDAGQPFNVAALLLDENAHRSFVEYADKCIAEGDCGGIQLPETGVQILDFNTVIRE